MQINDFWRNYFEETLSEYEIEYIENSPYIVGDT